MNMWSQSQQYCLNKMGFTLWRKPIKEIPNLNSPVSAIDSTEIKKSVTPIKKSKATEIVKKTNTTTHTTYLSQNLTEYPIKFYFIGTYKNINELLVGKKLLDDLLYVLNLNVSDLVYITKDKIADEVYNALEITKIDQIIVPQNKTISQEIAKIIEQMGKKNIHILPSLNELCSDFQTKKMAFQQLIETKFRTKKSTSIL